MSAQQSGQQSAQSGVAAGVPYVALPPAAPSQGVPLVLAWHMMDPPRSETAFAAALPLGGVNAWRVYLGLPMFGRRLPPGGLEEVYQRASRDYLLEVLGPVVDEAVAELPGAVDALREQLRIDDGPVGLVGGSAGACAALLSLAQDTLPVAAAALISPVIRSEPLVAAGERRFGVTYPWGERSRALAERLDFVDRAAQIARRPVPPALLLITGDQDDPSITEPAAQFHAALRPFYAAAPDRLDWTQIPHMQHALAEEPGLEPAPQTPHAARVDVAVTHWFQRHLPGARTTEPDSRSAT